MKSFNKYYAGLILVILIIISPILFTTGSLVFIPSSKKGGQNANIEFHVYATRYEFKPNRLTIPYGANVTLILHAEDRIHGFWIDGYNIKQTMCNDHVFTLTFVADKAGTFLYRCSEPACGPYHPYMTGILKVTHDQNLSYFYQVGILTTLGIVGYVILRKKTNESS